MDILALILIILAIIVGLGSAVATSGRFTTVGVAVALFAAAYMCQTIDLTGTHVIIHH